MSDRDEDNRNMGSDDGLKGQLNLHSQLMRAKALEVDPLRLACGWNEEDLEKPCVLVETVGGQSYPGNYHLQELATHVVRGVESAGGAPGRYECTDICDGIAQGTEGMYYSLASREIISFAVEIHFMAGHFDGIVLLSSADKSVPAHLMTAARLDRPTIIVPGGIMEVGPDNTTFEMVGALYSKFRRGEIAR